MNQAPEKEMLIALRKPVTADLPDSRAARIRMAPHDREQLILDHAMRFFADQGLDGQTRELANQLGITQSLLYRYFPSKDALIERVYEKWYAEFWDPGWEDILGDRSKSLEARLLSLYRDYARVIYKDVWVRLFVFSALKGLRHHVRFVARVRERLYPRILAELRFDHALPTLPEVPVTEFESELTWGLHATIFYIGQRRWLYHLPVPDDIDGLMAARIRGFITVAPPQIAAHLASLKALKIASD